MTERLNLRLTQEPMLWLFQKVTMMYQEMDHYYHQRCHSVALVEKLSTSVDDFQEIWREMLQKLDLIDIFKLRRLQ